MKTILVPFDFSEQAENAFEFAKGLAIKNNAHLKLLHVLETPTMTSLGTMGTVESGYGIDQIYVMELVEKRKKQLAAIEEELTNSDFKFSTKLIFGNPYAGISKEVSEFDANLIVMGSKGSSGLEELLIGSNTEKVVRNATCPVITIKDKRDVKDIKTIVFASDFTKESATVVNKLKKLANTLSAQLCLVKINTPSMFENSRVSLRSMQEFIKDHELQNTKVEIYNSSSEEEGIIEYAEDINADMIAMATHGRTGFLHLLSGSIAEDVVNHAKRPVWTMKIK
ncbi:universal stress protein UspA-like protein [Belliella baltica DSM 15883]|uniref:Universal stress protein UspA-like protein n=1 Tax=Belliella baltica (strain DSM 15883 / CIP 108006 / LMG 21964 / BA134) TaxID=866536 RepID=I3Z6C7_BELBD|nr:universal stress protein [Belliella baltica]AFL84795.1 universal stress protein UspA-like protein [Belliella baltica DSM 15883]